jgi:hypothetical protein
LGRGAALSPKETELKAFELAESLLVFLRVRESEPIAPEEKRAIYTDMLAGLPPEMTCPTAKRTLAVLNEHLTRALNERPAEAPAQEPQEAAPKAGKAGKVRRV